MKKLFVFILKMNVSNGGPDIEIQFELLNQRACYTHFLKQWACYGHCPDAKTQILLLLFFQWSYDIQPALCISIPRKQDVDAPRHPSGFDRRTPQTQSCCPTQSFVLATKASLKRLLDPFIKSSLFFSYAINPLKV